MGRRAEFGYAVGEFVGIDHRLYRGPVRPAGGGHSLQALRKHGKGTVTNPPHRQ